MPEIHTDHLTMREWDEMRELWRQIFVRQGHSYVDRRLEGAEAIDFTTQLLEMNLRWNELKPQEMYDLLTGLQELYDSCHLPPFAMPIPRPKEPLIPLKINWEEEPHELTQYERANLERRLGHHGDVDKFGNIMSAS